MLHSAIKTAIRERYRILYIQTAFVNWIWWKMSVRKKRTSEGSLFVRAKGIEPIRLSAPDPKSGLSTNFNTPAKRYLNEKADFHLLFLGSGSGIRTARPSGYEPDELPTALSRDIGLQIYGQFLKVQIFIAKIQEFPTYFLLRTISAHLKTGSWYW